MPPSGSAPTAACSQRVAAARVPVRGAVDVTEFLVRDAAQILLAFVVTEVAAIGDQSHTFHGGTAGILRMIRPATFVFQDMRE